MTHSGLKERLNKILLESIARRLKEHGFRKRGDVFSRECRRVVHLIDIQYSRWNDSTETNFTLNCGVYMPGITAAFRNSAEPKVPKPTDCCIAVRIGMLTESQTDSWWTISAADDPERDDAVREEIASVLEQVALPFLNRFDDPRAVAEFLSGETAKNDEFVEPRAPGLRFAYAALAWRVLGETRRCQEDLRRAVASAERTPLQDIVSGFARRWSCA